MFLKCNGCGQSVPGGMANCQFCGASLAGAAPSAQAQALAGQRSIGGSKPRQYERISLETPAWVENGYTLCSVLYALGGAVGILLALLAKHGDGPGMAIVVGLLQIALGVALVLRVQIVRDHINVFLWLSVGVNAVLLFLFTMASLGAGGLFWLTLIAPGLTVTLSLALIYLNNELG